MFTLPPQVILSDFTPKRKLIADVTISATAEVTTTDPHGYQNGMVVRVNVPAAYGMSLYQQTKIVVTGDTTFQTTIDTLSQFPFVEPVFDGTNPFTQAQVVPITGVEDNIAR